jgi:hypothetical protein
MCLYRQRRSRPRSGPRLDARRLGVGRRPKAGSPADAPGARRPRSRHRLAGQLLRSTEPGMARSRSERHSGNRLATSLRHDHPAAPPPPEHPPGRVAFPAGPLCRHPDHHHALAPFAPSPNARSRPRRRDRTATSGLSRTLLLSLPRLLPLPRQGPHRPAPGLARQVYLAGRGRENPVRQQGTPFLESPGAERKTARRRGSGCCSPGEQHQESNRREQHPGPAMPPGAPRPHACLQP